MSVRIVLPNDQDELCAASVATVFLRMTAPGRAEAHAFSDHWPQKGARGKERED
jgi:hypothetical protein